MQQAGNVASTPYQGYNGQLVAPVNSQQTAGINNINSNAGSAAPLVGQAAGLASSASNPLTASQISNYQSPYTQQVVNATQAQFNDQNAQQQAALTGNQIAQGALGGNRSGIAASNLAGQQQLSQAPVIAGLENQGYTNALQTAAQQYQQNPLAAANSIANFGISGQNAALQGANAQVGAGTLQQQTQQQQDTAGYNQFQLQQAYPFQQTQWLAGLDTALGGAEGSSSSGTTTGPPPNQTAQYLGLGLLGGSLLPSGTGAAALGALSALNRGGVVHKADAGGIGTGYGGFPYGVSSTPWGNVQGYIPTGQISGGHPSSSPFPQSPNTGQSSASGLNLGQLSSLFKKGNSSPSSSTPSNTIELDGGNVYDPATGSYSLGDPWAGIGGYARGGFVRGYADGGDPTTMDDRFAPVIDAIQSGVFDPQGANSTDFRGTPGMNAANSGIVPLPVARNTTDAPVADDDDDAAATTPVAATPTAGISQPAPNGTANAGLAQPAPASSDSGSSWWTPNLRAGILSAGLGMLASRSPFLGVAVGEGGLQGVKAYSEAEGVDAKTKQDAIKQKMDERRLEFEANRIQQTAQAQAETHRHNVAAEGQKENWVLVPGDGISTADRVYNKSTGEVKDVPPGKGRETLNKLQNGEVNYAAGAPPIQKGDAVPEPAAIPGYSAQAIKDDAAYYMATGNLPKASVSPRNPMGMQSVAYQRLIRNYSAAVLASKGMSDDDFADLRRFGPQAAKFPLSRQGDQTVAIGTAIRHINALEEYAKVWNEAKGDINAPILRQAAAKFATMLGKSEPTNLEQASRIAGPEIIKAIGVAGAGTGGERTAQEQGFQPGASTDQILGAANVARTFLAGQLPAKEAQAAAVHFPHEKFMAMVGPTEYDYLSAINHGKSAADSSAQPSAPSRPPGAVGTRADTSGREWYVDGAGKPLAPVSP
jgi:hypothetical protein